MKVRYIGGPVPRDVRARLPMTDWRPGFAYDVRHETGVWLTSQWPMMFRVVRDFRDTMNTMHGVSEAK